MQRHSTDLNEILGRKLRKLGPAANTEWDHWEYKTLNIHRVVLDWKPANCPIDHAQISATVRREINENFKVSWWRGMGFGVVLHLDNPLANIAACVDDIDGRENTKGTWQWSIIVLRRSRVAIGVHMWESGYLSDVFDQALGKLRAEGYKTEVFKKDKDELLRFLTQFHPIPEYSRENGTKLV